MRTTILVLAHLALTGMASPQVTPAFEVASVKPTPRDSRNPAGTALDTDPAMVRYSNISLKILISLAYQIDSRRIHAGPSWLDDQGFDVTAKLPSGTSKDQVPSMLQMLLGERFKLAVHRETGEQQVYFLRVGKNGHKLKQAREVKAEDLESQHVRGDRLNVFIYKNEIIGNALPVQQLAATLSHAAGRECIDRTGLTGLFDVDLKWADGADQNRPDLFTAIQEQLGLRLEPGKAPVETLVVDHAERIPAEN